MLATKKYLASCFFAILFLTVWPFARAYAAEPEPVQLFVDNVPVFSDVKIYDNNGTVFVPLRLVAEELGAVVNWDGQQVQIQTDTVDLWLYPGQLGYELNGEHLALENNWIPYLQQERVYVPLRLICNTLSTGIVHRRYYDSPDSWTSHGLLFLYTPLYDELQQQQEVFRRGEIIFANTDGRLYRRLPDAEKAEVLLDKPQSVEQILAVSNSGVLYKGYAKGEIHQELCLMVYSLLDGQTRRFADLPQCHRLVLDSRGRLFYIGSADEYSQQLSQEDQGSYRAIISREINGEDKTEFFVSQNHYGIWGLACYHGNIYYQERPAVAAPWGYDTYSGAVYSMSTGGCRKRLTEERVYDWSVQADGLHYNLNRQEYILTYDEMDLLEPAEYFR